MGNKFDYSCEKCQHVINLDSDAAGSTMQCPQCGNAFVVTPPQAPAGKKTGKLVLILGLALVVIAGIVVAAMFMLSSAREDARWENCKSKIKDIGSAMMMYAYDNKGYTPAGQGKDNLDLLIKGGYWGSSVDNVTDEERKKYLKCPSDKTLPSYAYVGEGLCMGKDNPGLPVVVEFPENHGKLVCVITVGTEEKFEAVRPTLSFVNIPEDCKTILQVVEFVLQQNGVKCECGGSSKCGRCKVLENAKKY